MKTKKVNTNSEAYKAYKNSTRCFVPTNKTSTGRKSVPASFITRPDFLDTNVVFGI